MTRYDYIREGAAIYERSFAIIRAEADLSRFTPEESRIAVRMIHGCGMVEVAEAIRFGGGFAKAARAALLAGAPILCDSKMVANGITRARLPAMNEILCTLDACEVPAIAARIGNTRSAAALELWGERLGGALVAIGNAPTALFHLLELIDAGRASTGGGDRPAGRVRGRRRIEGGARGLCQASLRHRRGSAGWQRHGGLGRQCAGERAE